MTPHGYIAFAAHNSVGSSVYFYDKLAGNGVVEACENAVHGGLTITSPATSFFVANMIMPARLIRLKKFRQY